MLSANDLLIKGFTLALILPQQHMMSEWQITKHQALPEWVTKSPKQKGVTYITTHMMYQQKSWQSQFSDSVLTHNRWLLQLHACLNVVFDTRVAFS